MIKAMTSTQSALARYCRRGGWGSAPAAPSSADMLAAATQARQALRALRDIAATPVAAHILFRDAGVATKVPGRVDQAASARRQWPPGITAGFVLITSLGLWSLIVSAVELMVSSASS